MSDMGIETPANVNDAAEAEDYFTRRRNWATYWGGMAEAGGPPLIHSKLRELRLKVGSLAAKKQQGGPAFAVKSARDLFQKLGQALSDLNLIAPTVQQRVTLIPTERGTACHVEATVRIAAEDGSFIDLVGSGHGMDRDDKAGGKASTYAWKDAILKGLTIPEKDLVDSDDEEGVGADVRPGRKPKEAGAAKAEKSEPSAVDRALDKIAAATTKGELRAMKPDLMALALEDQQRVSPVWKARLEAVPEEGN